MKAAVLHQLGGTPTFEDFQDPVAGEGQTIMTVKAASIKNLDKLRASGKHYASYVHLPAIVGIDGVGILEDGTRVYANGIHGTIAEKAIIAKDKYVKIPDGVSDALAAALPNAVIGAAMALVYRAKMKEGDHVLINGATGITGQLAVQIAKHLGASRITATGRNAASLEKVKELGADAIISLKEDDETIIKQIKILHTEQPIDIVIDYLWGHPVELIIKSLKGGGINNFTHPVRIVTVGSMAGEEINLSSSTLRSSAIEILGSGIGSLSQAEMEAYTTKLLPEMFQLAAEGKLELQTETVPLKDVASVWHKETEGGVRLVITMN